MITHTVIDLASTVEESNRIMNGSWEQCYDFVTSQPLAFAYKIEPLQKYEMDFLNQYAAALKQGENYLKTGNINSFL